MEKIVAFRLTEHLTEQRLYTTLTSLLTGKNNSVETALLRVVNDVRAALDRRKGTLFVLIDLSVWHSTQ